MANSIKISNLGPVAHAELDLKPLTILVGPNNSGKSHVALTVYALAQTLTNVWHPLRVRRIGTKFRRAPGIFEFSKQNREDATRAFKTAIDEAPNFLSGELQYDEMPTSVKQIIGNTSEASARLLSDDIDEELRRCFGSNLENLARRSRQIQKSDFDINLTNQSTGLSWSIRSRQNKLITTDWATDLSKGSINLRSPRFRNIDLQTEDPQYVLQGFVTEYMTHLFKGHASHSHYLPATRSGILQGHKTLASLIVDKASRAWIEPLDVPKLPGVTTDLIRALLLLGQRPPAKRRLRKIVDFLESEVTEGTVGIESQLEYPDIYYENELGRFELHTVSSMISEIAPLILFLKFLIQENQLLIFEEPESHLDPSNQRKVARAIAMTVNAGVNVIVTTHSDIFLNQINNLTQLRTVNPNRRRRMGYKATEVLRGDDIGVYLFKTTAEGTRVDSAEVDSDYGISTEFSDQIHRTLYEEAIKLEHQAPT